MSELGRRREFAAKLAEEAGRVTLRYFGTALKVEDKADQSPVTIADRESEQCIRAALAKSYPDDAILGEEFGERPGSSGWRWVVDPIDGTKSFIHGVPLYGVMIGLEGRDGPVVGAVALPPLGEVVSAACGEGCWWNGRPARASVVSDLSKACVAFTALETFDERGPDAVEAWVRVRRATRLQRGWGDCYGHILVATGRADVMLDPVLNRWDCVALLPILEEAGGRFTDWWGRRSVDGASGISTNGPLFEAVLREIHGPEWPRDAVQGPEARRGRGATTEKERREP